MIRVVLLILLMLMQPIIALAPRVAAKEQPAAVVFFQLQTGTQNAATQEYIALYNNSTQTVDVSGWCVVYSSASDATHTTLGCINAPAGYSLLLPSMAYVSFATQDFMNAHKGFTPDVLVKSGIAATAGHVRLFNAAKQEIDKLGWGAAINPEGGPTIAHGNNTILQRRVLTEGLLQDSNNNAEDFEHAVLTQLPASYLLEEIILEDACSNIEGNQEQLPDGYGRDVNGNCLEDACQNIDDLQIDIPDGLVRSGVDCITASQEGAPLIITELLPNPSSYDSGKEFIEIYNPLERPVSTSGYRLQISPTYAKSFVLPEITIQPKSYVYFSDTESGLVLPNTSAQLRLVAPTGDVVSQSAEYSSPKENMAWALLGDTWQFTNQPTPGEENRPNYEDDAEASAVSNSQLGSCPAGQYRNPDTNRCKLLQVAAAALVPCGANQERNPATNRCRSVLSASSALVPCKENQVRNPDTNRCRSIEAANSLQPCQAGQERNPETNRCRKVSTASALASVKDVAAKTVGSGGAWWMVVLALVGLGGYGVYEWRHDIMRRIVVRKARNT